MVEFNISALREGDREEFASLFRFYSPKLQSYFRKKMIADDLISDIMQTAFIKIWSRRELLKEDIKLSAQVFQIAKTCMIDELRSRSRRTSKMKSYFELTPVVYESSGAENLIKEKELAAKMNNVINMLPPGRRKVFLMKHEENLSYKEIADLLSLSVKTVNKHMQLAIRQIKPFLGNLLMVLFSLAFFYQQFRF